MNILGVDLGFMYTKAIAGDSFKIKSVVGGQRSLAFNKMTLSGANKPVSVKVDGDMFFVSDLALQQSESIYYSLKPDRFSSITTKVLLHAILSMAYPNRETTVRVVSGLPVSHYELYREQLKQLVLGEHRIEVYHGTDRLSSLITVPHGKFLPQPIGTLFNKVLDDQGGIKEGKLINRVIGVIDIGFGTTDMLVTESLTPVERLTFSTNTAVNHICRLISSKLHEQFGVVQKGKSHDITNVIKWALVSTAEQLLGEIQVKWVNDWEIDHVVFTGGGSILLYPIMSPNFHSHELMGDSQWSNVRGYIKWGKRSWRNKDA